MTTYNGVKFTRSISLKKVPAKYRSSGVLVFSTAYPYSPMRVHAWFETDAGGREFVKTIPGKPFFIGVLSYRELAQS